jgi:hypothetical protein
MMKKKGIKDNIVDLDAFRKEKYTPEIFQIHVGGYYAHLEMGVHLHCVGITDPMHTKDAEQHFIVEDHFGNIVTFRIDDPPPGFVVSNLEEFAAAAMGIPDPDDPQVS